MTDPISTIRLPIIDNFIRIIQSLAKGGKSNYQKYFLRPISQWSSSVPSDPLDKLLDMIEIAEIKSSKKVPYLYKKALLKSADSSEGNLSIPGNISINFLKSMRRDKNVLSSKEALKFINILRDPFKEYSDLLFNRMNKQFEDEINTAEFIEVEKLIKIREGEKIKIKMLQKKSEEAVAEINKLIENKNIVQIRQSVIKYLIQLSNPSIPDLHQEILHTIEVLDSKEGMFKKELLDAAAIIIYHEILKGIKNKNLDLALQYISKYAILFRGNPKTPNFHEVDTFEKKFFNIIEKRNLWEKLSK